MRRARIVGTGFYVPPTLVTNAKLGEMMGKPVPNSISEKLGIKQRYITGDSLSSADLGYEAGKAAIADAERVGTAFAAVAERACEDHGLGCERAHPERG